MVKRARRTDLIIGLVALGAALLVGMVGIVSYRSIGTLLRAHEWEVHTQVVLTGLERESRFLREAESARRGFVLTSDPGRAEEFRQSADGVRRILVELRQLTSDNRRQKSRLADLTPLVEHRLRVLSESVERHHGGGFEPGSQAAATQEGVALDIPIWRLLDDMTQEERALLEERRAKANRDAATSERTVVLSTALALLALASAGRLLLRIGRARREVKARLEETVAVLSKLTVEKTLLAELSEALISCVTLEEAYGAVIRAATRLFPGTPGDLLAVDPSQARLVRAVEWGRDGASGVDSVFEPDDCWAVRRGKVSQARESEGGLCAHIRRPTTRDRHACFPMMGPEGAIGVLHLELPMSDPAETVRAGTDMAQVVTSALSNLRLREKLRVQSIRDPLTGLFNRRYMEESLTREIRRAERSSGQVGVIMMDVDHFKRTNDEHGHAAGDSVLRDLGALLRSHIRGSDLVCRYGGEEFTLILPEADLEETFVRAEAVRVAVAAAGTRLPNGALVTTTISQGIAAFPMHGLTPDDLLHAADGALYRAKQGGRNRVDRARVAAVEAAPQETPR